MPKKLHKEIPIDYAVCQQQDFPRAEKCLHQIAYRPASYTHLSPEKLP